MEYIGQTSFLRITYFDQPPEEEKDENEDGDEEEVVIAIENFRMLLYV